ncbi:MAG: hypothetical protein OEQ28_04255, partial [Acidobacteriota bacterium]|nr:hypothetical protein [Acidobacteriota bacterium]
MEHEYPLVPGHLASKAISAKSLICGLPSGVRRCFSQIGKTKRLGRFETAVSDRQTPALFVLQSGLAETVYFNRLNRRYMFNDVKPMEMIG